MTQSTPQQRQRHDTVEDVTGRSGRGTARQTIRVPEDLWAEFGEAAGDSRSELVRAFIRWHLRKPGADMPPQCPEPGGESDG